MTKYKDVPPRQHRAFFQKAEEWMGAARSSADMGNYNASVASCVHSAINAVDAVTVLRTGKRTAGSHTDALCLIRAVFAEMDRSALERQYSFLLGLKHPAEYDTTMMTARQAADALKCAERILARARAEIAK